MVERSRLRVHGRVRLRHGVARLAPDARRLSAPRAADSIGVLLVVATLATGAGAAGWLRLALVPAYVGSLLALLLVSALVLAIFLVLLARSAQRK